GGKTGNEHRQYAPFVEPGPRLEIALPVVGGLQPRFDQFEQEVSNGIAEDAAEDRRYRGDRRVAPGALSFGQAHRCEHDIRRYGKKGRLRERKAGEIALGVAVPRPFQYALVQGSEKAHSVCAPRPAAHDRTNIAKLSQVTKIH